MLHKWVLLSALFCAAVILLMFPMVSYGQCPFQCPTGAVCGCTNCGPCNSGNFSVGCVCQGSGCTAHNGTCGNPTDCAFCCQGGHCSYTPCTGQVCPPNTSPTARVLSPASGARFLNVSLSRDSLCANPVPAQVEQLKCDDCTVHAINLGPKSNGQNATLLVPRDVPLDFSALQIDLRDDGIHGGSYVLRNNSGAGLVTLVTSWSFEGKSGVAHATDVIDLWASDAAFLAPGSEAPEDLRFLVLPHSGEVIGRVTGTVLYAEFDDGTRSGPGVSTIGPNLRLQRTRILAAYKELLNMIQSGSDSKTIATYLQTTPGLRWLNSAHGSEGLNGLVAEITKPRRLAP
jgi:hypothetical protein